MDKLEKNIKESLNDKFIEKNPSDDIKKRLFSRLGLRVKQKKFSKSNLIKLCTSFACLVLVIICSILIFSNDNVNTLKYEAIIQIDVNPSVEFVVDDSDKVLSVKGLNDDGKLILTDEEFENLSLKDAVSKLLNLEEKTNFLSETNKNVALTLTIENKGVEEVLTNKLNQILKSTQNNLSTNIEIKFNTSKSIEDLKDYVNSIEIIKNVQDLQYSELIGIVRKYHEDVRTLDSIALENLYLKSKTEYFEELKENKIKELVNDLDDSYKTQIDRYNKLYLLVKETYNNLQATYESLYVDNNSPYKMALKDLEEVKDEIALQEKKVEEAKKGSSYYILKKEEAILEGLKAKYEICSAALEYQEQIASEAYKYISNELEELLKELKDVKESLPESIKNIKLSDIIDTEEKEKECEESIKSTFITKYQNDIDNARKEKLKRKESLINE